jgi:hypothetical protein
MLHKSLILSLGFLAAALAAQSASAANATLYKTETDAAQACADDTVVWVKLDAHLYFHKEQTGYGGQDGLYACEKGARHSGYFASKS